MSEQQSPTTPPRPKWLVGVIVVVAVAIVIAAVLIFWYPKHQHRNALASCEEAVAALAQNQAVVAGILGDVAPALDVESELLLQPQLLTALAADYQEADALSANQPVGTCAETDTSDALRKTTQSATSTSEQLQTLAETLPSQAQAVFADYTDHTVGVALERLRGAVESAQETYSDLESEGLEDAALTSLHAELQAASTYLEDEPDLDDISDGKPGITAQMEEINAVADSLREAQLAAQLSQLVGETPVGITIVDLQTGDTVFELDADQAFAAASTYKVFVGYSMLQAIESGERTWESRLHGQSLRGCLEEMILWSDNDCPEAWISQVGFGGLEEQARAGGAAEASLRPGDLQVTSRDMAAFLTNLYEGELLADEYSQHLLDLMSEQEFRDGIPAGVGESSTSGIRVADKVGFLDSSFHDVGVVYSPKGDFVFSIYTEMPDWELIADISNAIYDWLE